MLGTTNADAPWLSDLHRLSAAESALPVVALGLTCELLNVEQVAGQVSRLLEACASCEIEFLNLAFAPGSAAFSAGRLDYAEAAHVIYTGLRDMRHAVESSGVRLNLEAGRSGLLLSPLQMREMIDAINSWAVGACVNTATVCAFSRPADWLTTLGRRVRVLRAMDQESCPSGLEGAIILEDNRQP